VSSSDKHHRENHLRNSDLENVEGDFDRLPQDPSRYPGGLEGLIKVYESRLTDDNDPVIRDKIETHLLMLYEMLMQRDLLFSSRDSYS